MSKLVFVSLSLIVTLLTGHRPAAAIPTQVSFAGRLADAGGPVDRAVTLDLRLFDGETLVWEESHEGIAVDDGLLFVALGSVTPLDDTVFTGAALQLEIAVDGAVMDRRLPILAVPYATRAGQADRANDADLLGGQPAAAFASADHDHAGEYAVLDHDHAGEYAALDHDHAGEYAALDHDHDGAFAESGHDHDGDYLPFGSSLSCAPGYKVTAIAATGNVLCGPDYDTDTQYTALPSGGLTRIGTAFAIASDGVTAAHIATAAVGNAEIAANAIDRSKAQGTEVLLYQSALGCGANTLFTSDSCLTEPCAVAGTPPALLFRACNGACTQPTAAVCVSLTPAGYLLGPTF